MGQDLGHIPDDSPDHPWAKPKIVFGVRRPPASKATLPEPEAEGPSPEPKLKPKEAPTRTRSPSPSKPRPRLRRCLEG